MPRRHQAKSLAPASVAGVAFAGCLSFAPVLADEPEVTPEATASQRADSQPASEPSAEESTPQSLGEFLLTTERLTGDWAGGRKWLEENGLTFALSLTSIYQHNAHGGLKTHNGHRVSGSYDLELTFDMGAASDALKGGTLYAIASGSWDTGVSPFVGDYLVVNYDAADDRPVDVWELWYEQNFGDVLRVRLGKLCIGIDFDTNAYANDETSQFLNFGLINTRTIPLPQAGQGIQFIATPVDWLYFGAIVMDAEADFRETGFRTFYHGPANLFSMYEFGLTPTWDTPLGQLPGNYRFGLWYDPQPKEMFFNDLDGRRTTIPLKRDDVGFYASLDQLVFREQPDVEGDEQGFGVFARYGYAHDDVNFLEHFWSIGAQYRGLIPNRDNDVLGVGAAQGILSERLRLTGVNPDRETAIEVYYNAEIFPWLTLTPDFQWVLNPGGLGGRDAFVAGVRLQMSF